MIGELAFVESATDLPLIAGFLYGTASSAAFGSTPLTSVSCATNGAGSGSVSTSATKSGTYVGFRSGDTYVVNFNNCKFGTSSLTLSGGFTLTALSTIQNPTVGSVLVFKADITNFNQALASGTTVKTNGSVNMSVTGITDKFDTLDITATMNSNRSVAVNGSVSGLSYGAGSVVRVNDTSTVAFSNSVNGLLTFKSTAGTVGLNLQTATALSGIRSASSTRLVPTAGNISIADTGSSLKTQAIIAGTPVTVNYNNTANSGLNSSFQTTYASLTQ